MSKKKKRPVPLVESGYDQTTDENDTVAEYLNFAANGMTDNEKIDDCDYYNDFISRPTDR